ncbi:uncharacterized protein LOC113386442 [Ctenocephalides felis]|uniref:uncharacterized protein LOC113386442 n=1 Tax=Ctenocephalides felis TaxID=7515 RepID=UPI000E6E3CE6|nr:uncharacterized protein LOC113386442 [Ctenocephalides felis]
MSGFKFEDNLENASGGESASSSGTEVTDGIKQILLKAYSTYDQFPYDDFYKPYYIPHLDYIGVRCTNDDTYLAEIWRDFENNGKTVDIDDSTSPNPTTNLAQSSTHFYDKYFANEMRKNLSMSEQLTMPKKECVFCKNNGTPALNYKTHFVKDLDGRVTCPVLRACICPICSATGDMAHTPKYCPLKHYMEFDYEIPTYSSFRGAPRSNQGQRLSYASATSSMPVPEISAASAYAKEIEDLNNNFASLYTFDRFSSEAAYEEE